jgi:two-component system, NarL family, sensor histidine kinase DesK
MRWRLLPDSHLGWTPYAWLIYLSFFVLFAALNDPPHLWLIYTPALAAFLFLYFRGFWVRGRPLLFVAFAIVGIGVVLAPLNPGASCFFIYGAAFLGDTGPPRTGVVWLAVIVGIIAVETLVFDLQAALWIPAVVFSLLVGGTNIHHAETRRKDQMLLKAHEAAEHMAKIVERERIARDLHDLLGHTLSVIVLKSELATKLAERDMARAIREISDVERISRNALAEVRQAVYGFRGGRFDEELASARTALETAGVTLDAEISAVPLDPDQERTLSLAVREAVTNVIRHARAGRCRIALSHDGTLVKLTVEDDGIGGNSREGAGLSGMRTRLAEIGGTLERDSRSGTRLTLTVPHRRDTSRAVVAS